MRPLTDGVQANPRGAVMAVAFTPTHASPKAGLPTRAEPDLATPPGPDIPGGLPVELLERSGDWARVRCDNGFEGWVELHLLDPLLRPDAGPAQPPAAPALDRSPISVRGRKLSAQLIGAVLLVASCFLAWTSPNGKDVSPFKIPVRYLINDKAAFKTGLTIGWLLLLAVAATIFVVVKGGPLLLQRIVGWAVVVVATLFVAQLQRSIGNPQVGGALANIGLGVVAAAAGGLLLALSGTKAKS